MATSARASLPLRLAGLAVVVGATGEGLILWHALELCYPFKVMTEPPPAFYASVGRIAALGSVGLALLAFAFLRRWPAPVAIAVPVAACPLLVVGAERLARSVRGGDPAAERALNFDGTTAAAASLELLRVAVPLSVMGAVIGAACGAGLMVASRLGAFRASHESRWQDRSHDG